MRRFFGFWLILLFVRSAWAQEDVRILVRGQEMAFTNVVVQNNVPYVPVEDKSLPRMIGLLGGEFSIDSDHSKIIIKTAAHSVVLTRSTLLVDDKSIPFKIPPPVQDGQWLVSVTDLAKVLDAISALDSERNIWYVDPWVTGIDLKAAGTGTSVHIRSSTAVQPTITRLENPPRLALDFTYAALFPLTSPPSGDLGALFGKIEVSQFQSKPNIVRVVLHLKNPNVQWSTGLDEQGREFNIFVSVLPDQAGQGGAFKETHSTTPATLGGIELKTLAAEEGEKLGADLKLSSAVSFAWRKLKAPDNRVYIDLFNCLQGTGRSISLDNSYFNEIRVAQFQKTPVPIVRVVFELKNAFHVNIETSSQGLSISVDPRIEENNEILSGSGVTGYSPDLALGNSRFRPQSGRNGNGVVVVLDPGHGGSDPGAHGRRLVEKDLTLDIAERLRQKLIDSGFHVEMTRENDQDVLGYHGSARDELQARVNSAKQSNAVLFISLHINSSFSSGPHGIQTHWYKSMDLPLASMIQRNLGGSSGFFDRGILRDRFYVLSHAPMSAVLVEMGFLSNAGDEAKLEDSQVRDKLAESISSGILEYSGMQKNAHL